MSVSSTSPALNRALLLSPVVLTLLALIAIPLGITGFSTVPLRAATYMGLATAGVAFVFAIWVIAKAAIYGDRVAGWPTMMAVILFLGGVQLIALGLIGEYLGRLYEESKQRPLYLVDAWLAASVADSELQPTLGGQADDVGTATVGRQVP